MFRYFNIWSTNYKFGIANYYSCIYYKADIEDYNDFLDCPNIKKSYFDRFSDVAKFSKWFIAFEVLDAIYELLKTFLEINKECQKKKKEMINNPLGYGYW